VELPQRCGGGLAVEEREHDLMGHGQRSNHQFTKSPNHQIMG
jgi:hypothetical protein